MTDLDRASGWAGVASVFLTNAATVGATLASPSFEWTENALSDLGQPGTAVATPVTTLLFDGGLVLAHAGVWWWWASGGSITRGGLAVPELVGALLFSAWVLWTAHRHL